MTQVQTENENEVLLNHSNLYQQNRPAKKSMFMAMFNAMTYLFNSEFREDIKTKKIAAQKSRINQINQASALLDIHHYTGYIKMINLGYKPTNEQKKIFDTHTGNLIDDNDYQTLENYLTQNMNVMTELYVALMLFDRENFKHSLINKILQKKSDDSLIQTYPLLTKAISSILETPECALYIQQFFIDTPFIEAPRDDEPDFFQLDLHFFQKQYDYFLNNYPEIFVEQLKFSDFALFMKENKENHLEAIKLQEELLNTESEFKRLSDMRLWIEETLPDFIKHYYENHIDHSIKQSEEVYKHNIETLLLKKIQGKTSHQIIVVLPQATRDKIGSIEEIYWNLKNTKNGLTNSEEDFTVDNIFEKRIPEVIEKFMHIPEEYRAKTVHETTGKTAYEMMMESLDNYHIKLKNLLDEKIQNQLSDMNATKIYSKKII